MINNSRNCRSQDQLIAKLNELNQKEQKEIADYIYVASLNGDYITEEKKQTEEYEFIQYIINKYHRKKNFYCFLYSHDFDIKVCIAIVILLSLAFYYFFL